MGWLDWFRTVSDQDAMRAFHLMAQGRYAEAEQTLRGATGAEHLAMLAECQFHTGRAADALASARRALESACEELRPVLWGTIYEACRYLGDAFGAAAACDELAVTQPTYRRQAELVRRGEPLLRVVANIEGKRFEIDEVLQGVAGGVRFMFERNRLALRPVADRLRKSEETLHTSDFDPDAHETVCRSLLGLCAYDPAPRYALGLALAHRGRWDEAEKWFEETERLAPGWFHVRSARHLVTTGDQQLFLHWHALAEAPLPDTLRLPLAEQAIKEWADCAYLHHLHGKELQARGQQAAAERAYRRGLELPGTDDLRTRLYTGLAATVTDQEESPILLKQAVALGADLPAAALARIILAFEGGAVP